MKIVFTEVEQAGILSYYRCGGAGEPDNRPRKS